MTLMIVDSTENYSESAVSAKHFPNRVASVIISLPTTKLA